MKEVYKQSRGEKRGRKGEGGEVKEMKELQRRSLLLLAYLCSTLLTPSRGNSHKNIFTVWLWHTVVKRTPTKQDSWSTSLLLLTKKHSPTPRGKTPFFSEFNQNLDKMGSYFWDVKEILSSPIFVEKRRNFNC